MPATKDQIAETFARHVEHYGLGKTTVEEVAAELGISKRTVYQHFHSKKEIFAYVVHQSAAAQKADIEARLAGLAAPGDRLEALMRTIFAAARAQIQATSAAEWHQQYEIAAQAFVEAYGAVVRELVEQGAEAGAFAMTDPVLVDRLLSALVMEYVFMIREDPAFDADETVVAAVRRFVQGG